MKLPAPPEDAVMPEAAQAVMLALTALAALCAVFLAVREARRRGDRVPVYVLLGTALAIFYEPVGDVLGLAYGSRCGGDSAPARRPEPRAAGKAAAAVRCAGNLHAAVTDFCRDPAQRLEPVGVVLGPV